MKICNFCSRAWYYGIKFVFSILFVETLLITKHSNNGTLNRQTAVQSCCFHRMYVIIHNIQHFEYNMVEVFNYMDKMFPVSCAQSASYSIKNN